MNIAYLIFFFFLGTIFSSFYMVVGYRLPKKENFTTTRSHCDSCGHILKLFEMIPIISFFMQKGKCRYCAEKLNPFMPILEFLGGLLFALSYYSFGLTFNTLISIGIASLLLIITVSDIEYLIIPDEVLAFFSFYFIVVQYFNLGPIGSLKHIGYGIFLFTIMYLIMLLGNFLFKKESLGGGDIKLMFLFGLILDPLLGTLSIFVASLIALPISFIFLIKDKEKVIPFGPFLIIGLAIIFYTKLTPEIFLKFLGF